MVGYDVVCSRGRSKCQMTFTIIYLQWSASPTWGHGLDGYNSAYMYGSSGGGGGGNTY